MTVFSHIASTMSRLLVPPSVDKPTSAAEFLQTNTAADASFVALCHPLLDGVSKEADNYFLEHWSFQTEKARKRSVAAGYSRVTCLNFPNDLDDRIILPANF